MKHRNLHIKTFVLILLMVVFGPVGDVLVSKGMKRVGSISKWTPSSVFAFFVRAFTSPFVWLGISCLLAFFISYVLVLSWADYSFVQPASSVGYAVVALLGWLMLGVVVTSLRWAGVLTICLGVFLIGHTPPRTTENS